MNDYLLYYHEPVVLIVNVLFSFLFSLMVLYVKKKLFINVKIKKSYLNKAYNFFYLTLPIT